MEPVWETLDEEVHRSNVLVKAMEDKINKAVAEWGPDALRVSASKGVLRNCMHFIGQRGHT